MVAGTGAFAYTVLLDDRAKEDLKGAVRTVRDSYLRIQGVIDDIRGLVMNDEDPLPNRQRTLEQWQALGY